MHADLHTTGSTFMTSGATVARDSDSRKRGARQSSLILILLFTQIMCCEALELKQLLPLIKQTAPATLHYREARTPVALKDPLRSNGRLEFVPPGTLHQWVDAPTPLHYTIEGNWLSVEDSVQGESRRMALSDVPALQQLTTCLVGLLTGNASLIEEHFQVKTEGTLERWRLSLTSKGENLSEPSHLVIEGKGPRLAVLTLTDDAGTTTVLELVTP